MINADELLFNVDEENNPIKPQPRHISHRDGIWHRTSHIWIVNERDEILCQQRSLLKDTRPGNWEPFFGGHLGPGQDYADSAVIELEEELGLKVKRAELKLFKINRHEGATEFQAIFLLRWSGEVSSLKLEEEEVEKVAWRTIDDVKRIILEEKDERWTHNGGYEKELLEWLKGQFN